MGIASLNRICSLLVDLPHLLLRTNVLFLLACSINTNLNYVVNYVPSRAYPRPILHSTIECCPFCKNYAKFCFDAKHLGMGLNRGGGGWGGEFLEALFSKKVPFFIKKCPFWPISNTALNLENISCPQSLLRMLTFCKATLLCFC